MSLVRNPRAHDVRPEAACHERQVARQERQNAWGEEGESAGSQGYGSRQHQRPGTDNAPRGVGEEHPASLDQSSTKNNIRDSGEKWALPSQMSRSGYASSLAQDGQRGDQRPKKPTSAEATVRDEVLALATGRRHGGRGCRVT